MFCIVNAYKYFILNFVMDMSMSNLYITRALAFIASALAIENLDGKISKKIFFLFFGQNAHGLIGSMPTNSHIGLSTLSNVNCIIYVFKYLHIITPHNYDT